MDGTVRQAKIEIRNYNRIYITVLQVTGRRCSIASNWTSNGCSEYCVDSLSPLTIINFSLRLYNYNNYYIF